MKNILFASAFLTSIARTLSAHPSHDGTSINSALTHTLTSLDHFAQIALVIALIVFLLGKYKATKGNEE